jgi:hypothetical protein
LKTIIVVILAFAFTLGRSCAEDWTVNGKTFVNVHVAQVDPDRVHITYDGGLGTVNLSDLTPDLQKRFNYSVVAAVLTAAQRQQAQDAEIAKARQMAKAQAAQAQADAQKVAAAAAAKDAQTAADIEAGKKQRTWLNQQEIQREIWQDNNRYTGPNSDGSGH